MSNTKHNIDELFKNGLENYAEKPARSLWRRLSWHMLRKEIAQFNFTNLPVSWTAVPAAAIIATVAIFNLNITETELPDRSATPPPTVVDSQPGVETTEQPPDAIRGFEAEAEHHLDQSKPEEPITITEDEAMASDVLASRQKQEDVVAAITPAPTLPESIISPTSTETDESVYAPEKAPAEHMAVETAAETQAGISQLERMNMQTPGAIETDLNGLTAESLIKTTGEDEFDISTITRYGEADSDAHSIGRIQKMHSLNYSLGYLFRGRYKPPKRDFQTQEMYNSRRNQNRFALALYVAPEITEYTRMASSSREKSFATGIALKYITGQYIIQAGAEVSHFYDLGDYMVRMETWDSIGYYHHVNGFIVDPENPGNIIFDTEEVPVWDSVKHHSHQQTRNTYTYLQFPLMIGYKAFEHGNFSAYIKTGPNFSLLLNRSEPYLDFNQPGATINAIDNYSLPRLTTNVQLLVGLALHLQATEKLGILAEPVYRYYLNTVYSMNGDGEKLKNPYSFGVRAGIFYTF